MRQSLPVHLIRRRGRKALRRMSARQRAIFWAMRLEDITYAELARRHGISAGDVEAEFEQALRIFLRRLEEREPWWQRLWP